MGYTYPLTLPTSPGIVSGTLKLVRAQSRSISPFTFATQIQIYPGEQWKGNFELPRMTQAQIAEWESTILKLRGMQGTFLWSMPTSNRGSLLAGVGGVNAESFTSDGYGVNTSGWQNSKTGVLLKGDWIQFSNYEYKKVVENVNSGVSGLAVVYFESAIRDDSIAGSSSAINITTPQGKFRLSAPEFEINYDVAQKFGMSIVFEEDIVP